MSEGTNRLTTWIDMRSAIKTNTGLMSANLWLTTVELPRMRKAHPYARIVDHKTRPHFAAIFK